MDAPAQVQRVYDTQYCVSNNEDEDSDLNTTTGLVGIVTRILGNDSGIYFGLTSRLSFLTLSDLLRTPKGPS